MIRIIRKCVAVIRNSLGLNCTPPAIDDFPKDFFTEEQRQNGAIIIHILVSLYLFVALAVVCDKFFVPAVERICKALNMSNDVAGATFMAAATSAPELFVNVIGTFITEGDIGVGTIVGSAVFNILAVAACCGIGAGMSGVKVIPLDWWPVTRDCIAYGFTVAVLICVIHDERIEWYEALTLVALYVLYIAVMYFDKNVQKCFRSNREESDKSVRIQEISVQSQSIEASDVRLQLHTDHMEPIETIDQMPEALPLTLNGSVKQVDEKFADNEKSFRDNLSTKSNSKEGGSNCFKKMAWLLTWPIHLIFSITIPDCEKAKFKHLFPFTFFMCIVWIGSLSYVIAWMITVVGDTLRIPDSVMGITFLAAGTSIPEAVSSVIVSKQGLGSMGISNSIGSNTFDILLCLGLPWFIKAAFSPTVPGNHWVGINSSGLEYNSISLLSTLFLLYLTFVWNKFNLDKSVGRTCLLMYAVFLILATLIELNVFFPVNLPTCGR